MDWSRLGQATVASSVPFVVIAGSSVGARPAYFGGAERFPAEGAKS